MASQLSDTMRAATYENTGAGMDRDIKLTTSHPLPANAKNLPKGHTLVRVSYTTINPVDFKLPEIPVIGRYIFPRGIPGADFAGTVVESTLPHLVPGQLVFGMTAPGATGTLGEYVVIPEESCVPVPDGLDLKDAATLPVGALTAYQSLKPYLDTTKSNKVFINGGSGGVGTFQIQLAKILGCQVTTTCSGANVELCKSLGADEVIDYRTENVVATLLRKGHQYDLIVDNIFDSGDLYWACKRFLKPDAHYISISAWFNLSTVKNFASIYLWPRYLGGGQRRFSFIIAWPKLEEFAQLARWVVEGKMKPVIEREYDLGQAGDAFARLKSGRTRGKLVIKVT